MVFFHKKSVTELKNGSCIVIHRAPYHNEMDSTMLLGIYIGCVRLSLNPSSTISSRAGEIGSDQNSRSSSRMRDSSDDVLSTMSSGLLCVLGEKRVSYHSQGFATLSLLQKERV